MNCIAVDDEKLVLDLIVDNIKQVPYLNLIKACKNAMDAVEVLQKERSILYSWIYKCRN